MFQMLPDLSVSDPTGRIPLYTSRDGQIGPDPFALAGERPRFSLSKLALYLAPPALVGEFLPDCPWAGVSRLRPSVPWPSPAQTTSDDLLMQFRQSVATCMGGASVVAVALSGGLDSTAVLFHAHELCQREGRRLLALTIDLTDDAGRSCAVVARQLIDALGISCELHIIREEIAPYLPLPEPYWHPAGPRNDAMPRLNRAVADVAATAGAEVLLSGDGADELLGAVRYLFPQLLRAQKWHAASSYLRDLMAVGGRRRLTTEALAMMASLLPASWSSWLYWATNWPELCTIQAPLVLAERFRPHVEAWTKSWLQQILTFHAKHHRSWAVADAWDAVFPSDGIPPAGEIPERDPFMTPSFTQYAMSLPLTERYSAHLPTPYHRSKALVVQLYPPQVRAALPPAKQLFSRSFEIYQQHSLNVERCLAYGLISKEHLDTCRDASLLRTIQAIEQWIIGAEQKGATATE